jgi:predicted transcriptional regulator
MNPNETHPHLTAEIVSKYVSHHKILADQLPELIATVHKAIGQLGKPAETEEIRTPAVSVRQSVRQDYIVCLDCGYRGLVLRRHLSVRHGLNPDEYRQQWGLKRDHPLTAPAYSERRSSVAKALGFGRRPANRDTAVKSEAAPAPVEADEKAATTSKPIRKARRAPKRAEAIEPAAASGKPARVRRPRRAASEADQPASPAGGS